MEVYHEKFPFIKDTVSKLNFKSLNVKYLNALKSLLLKGTLGVIASLLILLFGLSIIYLIVSSILVLQFVFTVLLVFACLGSKYSDSKDSKFVSVHEDIFGILFWLLTLGWCGAFSYWFLVSVKNEAINMENNEKLVEAANKIHGFAAWIPARLTGLVYALAGNFSAVYKGWLNSILKPAIPSSEVLISCGEAAIGSKDKAKEDALVTRALIIWCIIGIIFALTSF